MSNKPREHLVSTTLRRLVSLFMIFQLLFAAFTTPVAANSNTEEDDSTISIEQLINWIDSISGFWMTNLTEKMNNSNIPKYLISQHPADNKCQSGNNSANVDSDGDGKSDKKEKSKDTGNSKNDTEKNNTSSDGKNNEEPDTTESITSTTTNGRTESQTPNDGTNTNISTSQATSSVSTSSKTTNTQSTEDHTSRKGSTTTNNSTPGAPSTKSSRSSKSQKVVPKSEALPDINSPVIAIVGLLCALGGAIAISRSRK